MDSLADEGMTYNLVSENHQIISNQICVEYQERGIVCSFQLQSHVFTNAAIENLDHNLTSATAQSSFHGTTISICQHSAVPISSLPFWLNTTKADRCTKVSLPESFNKIKPTPEVKPEPSQHTSLTVSSNQIKSVLNEACTWFTVLGKHLEENTRTHFSAFYSHQAMSPIKTGSHLPLLIPEPVTAPVTVRHAVNIVPKITQKVHPGQISVIVVINQYMPLGNSSSGCSQLNLRASYGCWYPFTLSKYSLRQLVTNLKTAGGQTCMTTQTLSQMDMLIAFQHFLVMLV